jgi:hypothetical protein
VAASLLVAAALFAMWGARGGWLAAGAAGLAFGTGLAHRRGWALPAIAGAGWAMAGVAALAVAGGMFHGWEYPLAGPWSALPAMVIMVLVGALARGVTGAAWSVVAVGGLHVIAPVAGSFMIYSAGEQSNYLSVIRVLGLLSAALAVVVLARKPRAEGTGGLPGRGAG